MIGFKGKRSLENLGGGTAFEVLRLISRYAGPGERERCEVCVEVGRPQDLEA